MGYFRKVLGGVSWMSAFRISTRAIAYIKLAVIARILLPEQFGIFAIAALLLAFLETFTETGINIFFIQGEGKLKDYVSTAWVVSIIRGLFISLLIIISAPFIAGFFNEPAALTVIYLMASVPFFRAFINPSEIYFRKELEFQKEFLYRTFIFTIDALVAVSLALVLRSPSALVYGMAAGALTEVILSFIIFKPLPKFSFEMEKVKRVVSRGKWVAIGQTTNLAFKEGDDVFVGRLLDTFSLGIYQVAYKISTLPLTEVGQVVNSVTFPVYSKFSGEKKRLRRAYLKVLLAVFLITAPLGLVFYLFPETIILVLLGPNWLEATTVLKALAAFGVFRAVSSTTEPIYNSLKKQEYTAYVSLFSFAGMVATIIPFISSFGVVGGAYSAIVGLFVGILVNIFFVLKILFR